MVDREICERGNRNHKPSVVCCKPFCGPFENGDPVTGRFVLKIGDHLENAETRQYYTERNFSEVAPRYDFITRVLSFRRDAAWKRTLISLLPSHESPVCLDLARHRNTHPNVSFANQDMGSLDIVSESVDIVTGGYALRNAPDLGTAIDEISRVLKPCGVAAFLDFSKPGGKIPQKMEYWGL